MRTVYRNNRRFMDVIEHANSRGVGQFHVFEGHVYRSTWNSYAVAQAVARREPGRVVYNAFGERV